MNLKLFIKSGAILSSIGAALLVIFAVILLSYPTAENCRNDHKNCTYSTSAPPPLNSLIKPSILAISLLVVASGVAIIRFGSWYQYRGKKVAGGLQ
ncbi:MAG TPA: hypothetical protein VJR67_01265 [Candidatus Nitrosopolaris sp.]|nr:hypothetical protein [Candidatus Nitrosopolaris sp.]